MCLDYLAQCLQTFCDLRLRRGRIEFRYVQRWLFVTRHQGKAQE
jgi:hypothetical protein